MDLYVVRHAVAHDRDPERWPDDSERPLTPEGEERFRRVAGNLSKIVPEVDVVLSSPYARAWRTAELLADAGWPAPKTCEELCAECPPERVFDALAGYADVERVAIVGHRPCLHELVAYLLTGEDEASWVTIKKGGVVRLQTDAGIAPRPGAARLVWLLAPKVMDGPTDKP